MANEFCPKCRALKSMTISTTERNEKNVEGKAIKIITSSYHCDSCNTFVRSDDKQILLNAEM